MRSEKTITISTDEYRKLLQAQDLCHRQRFTIKFLERKLEEKKAQGSIFADTTLKIFLAMGYTFNEIMMLYGIYKKGKDETDNRC